MSTAFKIFTGLHIRIFRATGGRIGGGLMGGKILLLTTVGNKSGQPRTVPLMYFQRDGKNYIVASAGGAPQHPAWYKNLAANSQITVEIGPRRITAKAVTVDNEERSVVWEQVKSEMKQFASYEKKAGGRQIPLVRIDELGAA
jgi:deazaflavin-dependent oxidoreductase (nitroreductase family)